MTHTLHLPIPRPALARRTFRLPAPAAWPPTLLWMGGIVLFCVVALGTLPHAAWRTPAAHVVEAAAAAVEQIATVPVRSRARARCESCGVVEAIREMAPVGTSAAAYEFTVRLRDGSARISTVLHSSASAWVVGDSIMLIGGGPTAVQ